MWKSPTMWLAIILLLALSRDVLHAQEDPRSGFYQITSGYFVSCCGFVGTPTSVALPNGIQAFIELRIDTASNVAQMRILGQDMRKVARSYECVPGSGLDFSFSNGMVFPDHIQFGQPPDPSGLPSPPYYVISNSADAMQMNGSADAPLVCYDFPTHFMHTNIVAITMSRSTLRVSEVEFCWNSFSNRNYQVQYRSTLTTNTWVNLGSPIPGNGATNCITDKVVPSQPRRFFRVVTSP